MLEKIKGEKVVIFWTMIRLYLGWEWLVAGWEKIGSFDASGFLRGAVNKAAGEYPSVQRWYATFIEGFALPNVDLFNFLVVWGEVLVGLGLILGVFTTAALYSGAFMNLNFMLAGATSMNPILYTLAIVLLVMGSSSYRYGVDYYLKPRIKEMYKPKP